MLTGRPRTGVCIGSNNFPQWVIKKQTKKIDMQLRSGCGVTLEELGLGREYRKCIVCMCETLKEEKKMTILKI